MNYFELFGIPESFYPDQQLLKKRFFELSKQYHPDRFSLASGGEKIQALEKTAQINKGYKTLQDSYALLHYILLQKGVVAHEEKYKLPSAFLMEMMEINEQLMDAKIEEDKEALELVRKEIEAQIEIWENEITPVMEDFDFGKDAQDQMATLQQLKELYYRKKYLNRLLEQIG